MTSETSEATIRTEDGRTLRYFRCLNAEGTSWVRHGPFVETFVDGQVASEGNYEHGRESGRWRDFYSSGHVAAEGTYVDGKEQGLWRFWDEAGKQERTVHYRDGVEISS